MKLKLPKIKIFQILHSIKYIYGLIILLIVGAVGLLGLFIYNNLYKTIAQTEQIILLKQEVAPDTINLEKVETVLKRLDNKHTADSTIEWGKIKNPFNPPPQPKSTPEIQPNDNIIE